MSPYHGRAIDAELQRWSEGKGRKPLVLRGARQTGKTAAIRQLGRGFDLYLELNLERLDDRRLVEASERPGDLLDALCLRANVPRLPPRTLLFLDEVQASPRAVALLRYLYEDLPDLHVVAAGSLLEVRLQDRDLAFPVGRVTFRYLRPFSFFEFLGAVGRDQLAARLEAAARGQAPLSEALHQESLALLRDYLWVGGMPEAVARWADERSAASVRQVHTDLRQAFSEDLQKYEVGRGQRHLELAFGHLPHHYGQRFKYERFAPTGGSAAMKGALSALERAMIVRLALPTSDLRHPLHTRARAAPKLLPLDVGLALADLGVPLPELRTAPLDGLLDGRVAEILVGQLVLSRRMQADPPLYFWVSDGAGDAELDYLLAGPADALPVEVKAGRQGSLRSMHQYLWRSKQRLGVRLYAGPMLEEPGSVQMPDGELRYTLRSWPLYLAEMLEQA